MTKSKIFFVGSVGFIGGIGIASFCYPSIIAKSLQLEIVISLLIILIVFYKNKIVNAIGLIGIFFIFGIILANFKLAKVVQLTTGEKYFSGPVTIIQEPKIKDKRQTIIVKAIKNKERFLVNVSAYQDYQYGDDLKLSCQLQLPQNKNPDFDYKMYLAKENVFYQCQKTQIQKLNSNSGNIFYATLIQVKNKFQQNIFNLIPAPESGLLSGLILGGTNNLSLEVKNNFSQTGLMHIVAVSGYNVTIIAEYLMILGIFLGLWRQQAFWLATLGIILFVMLTGLSSSAIRAGIMGILLIWAMKNGRLANSQNAILFAADLMLIINPLLFRWDVGFQLSFLASLGIIYFYPFLQHYLVQKHQVMGLSEVLFLTLSAQVFVLPVLLFNFQKLSLISPLANLLILPIIPLTMLVGFLAVVMSFASHYLALIFAWLAFLPLKYETSMINFLASLKYSAVTMRITRSGVVIWYIILLGVICWVKRTIDQQRIA